MRENYDFSKSFPNPHVNRKKKPVTIRLDEDTISHFKCMSEDKAVPCQSLINLYLRDCARHRKELKLDWA